jgi:bacterioferritin
MVVRQASVARESKTASVAGVEMMALRPATSDNESRSTVLFDDLGSLVNHLNGDLAGELQSTVMYLKYSAFLRGLHRPDLSEIFQADIANEQRHARILADRISSLGGTPTSTPRPVPEAVGAYQMLLNISAAATRAVEDYTDRVAEAALHQEQGLKVELQELLDAATRRRNEVDKILAAWTPAGLDAPET